MSDFEPFVMVPHAYVMAPISDKSKVLFLVLAMYRNNETGLAWPGLETLAKVMGCSVSSVRRARKELETIGAIDSRQRWNATTVYNIRVSSPMTRGALTRDEGGTDTRVKVLTGENKSVTGETKSVTGENKSVTGEQLTRTNQLEPRKLEPINLDIDPRDSGEQVMSVFISELEKLIRDPYRPDYETHGSYGDPLERLALAIQLDPDGVEEQLKKKTKTAKKNLATYIAKILINNPQTLMSEDTEFMTLNELENEVAGDLEEVAFERPPAPISAPKTAAGRTTTPAPVARAKKPLMVEGVSAENMAWLGDRPTDYAIRCAQVATELGLTIPEGLDVPQAGQLVRAALDLVASGEKLGEQLDNPTGEMWQGRETLKAHKVKVSD